jgi:hypothetical protein
MTAPSVSNTTALTSVPKLEISSTLVPVVNLSDGVTVTAGKEAWGSVPVVNV